MMKKIVAVLLGTMIGSSLYAGNYDTTSKSFLGIEVGAATIEADTYGILGEHNHKGKNIAYGLRFGAQNKEWRTMLIGNYLNSSKNDQKYFKGQATFDYLLRQESALNPFIGLNIGYINYRTSPDNNGNDSFNSFLYGGEAGIIVGATDNIELDFGYRYSFCSSSHMNHTENIVFGMNYMF